MPATPEAFLEQISALKPSSAERVVALLWWHTKYESIGIGLSIKQLCSEIENAGYGQQNLSRLKDALKKDRRTVSVGADAFKLNIRAITDLDLQYLTFLKNKPIKHSDALFELMAFDKTRDYVSKVVLQINRSYEESLFDCCAVMIRRLLETLIIEIYEAQKRAEELKDTDGNFKMFSGLLNVVENDKTLHLGRTTLQGLKNFKRLADSSAHNRRFNASKKDIDDLKQDVQLAVAELRQLAFGK